jgi:hypothetical protein
MEKSQMVATHEHTVRGRRFSSWLIVEVLRVFPGSIRLSTIGRAV